MAFIYLSESEWKQRVQERAVTCVTLVAPANEIRMHVPVEWEETMPENYWEAAKDEPEKVAPAGEMVHTKMTVKIRQVTAEDVKGDGAEAAEACNRAMTLGALQPVQTDIEKLIGYRSVWIEEATKRKPAYRKSDMGELLGELAVVRELTVLIRALQKDEGKTSTRIMGRICGRCGTPYHGEEKCLDCGVRFR